MAYEHNKIILRGLGASLGESEGTVIVANELDEAINKTKNKKRYIIVAPITHPQWTQIILNSVGVVIESGGSLSHAAIICREFEIPCVVGVQNATKILKDGMKIKINGLTGMICKGGD